MKYLWPGLKLSLPMRKLPLGGYQIFGKPKTEAASTSLILQNTVNSLLLSVD